MKAKKTALIVGASRGLGLAIAKEFLTRGWNVIGTVREGKRTLLHELAGQFPGALQIEIADINRPEDVNLLKSRVTGKLLDLLFVNAGISNPRTETIGEVATEDFMNVMLTNALSPLRVVEKLADCVEPEGTIGVMSSGQGSVANNEKGGGEVYRASKAALNMLMRSYAARSDAKRSLLLMAPGWIKTDLGGPEASFTIEEAIPPLVSVILSQEGKPGLRYLDRFGKDVPW